MTRSRNIVFLFMVLLVLGLVPQARAVKSSKDLPPTYRHWLEAEVPYIISTEEKKEFLSFSTNEERDNFIDRFWRLRNPDPGSTANSYKDEHYRRLAYANENFGDARYGDGWRTDRGRMYIMLGAPKQKSTHQDSSNVRPMEVWFYQAETPVLPPYFYLVFYKQSAGEDYKLYSPRYDGPVRLCSTGETRNDPVQALGIIRKALGSEIARTAVSLLPTEHVNLQEWSPSMESEALLNAISNLPDNPYTVNKIKANRLREHVTSSLFLGDNDASLSYGSFRDHRGRYTLSYMLSLRLPDARLVGARGNGGGYYDMTLRTEVLTTSGSPIYTVEDMLKGDLTETQAENARKKRFAAEGRLPLTPGTYKLQVTLTNNISKSAWRQSTTATVPAARPQGLSLSNLVAYTQPAAVPDPHDLLPFSVSHFRFTPHGAQNVYIRQGDKLPLVFQLWLDAKNTPTAPGEKIHLHYQFGSVAATRNETTQEEEDVDTANRDEAGNLLTGHTVNTSNLLPGSYQLVVSATRAGEVRPAYATLNLHVAPADALMDQWTAFNTLQPPTEVGDDYKRGLSAEALNMTEAAEAAYSRALVEGHAEMGALDHLAALLQKKGSNDQLAGLGKLQLLTQSAASPTTLLMIAEALNKSGDAKSIVRMLEAQIKLQEPRADLYNTLADACQATGDNTRAKEVRGLASALSK